MGRAECGGAQDRMKAALGYRSPDCDPKSSLSCGSLEEEEETSPTLLALARSRDAGAADRFVSGKDGQTQSSSALKILQQQLESFQTFRQQTLQNVNMVQSEIRGILNKSIADLKSPECSLNNTLLISTPVNSNTVRECQETSQYKKQLHLDKRFGTSQSPEMDSGTTLVNAMTGEDISQQMFLKYKTTEKAVNHKQTSRDKTTLALSDDHKLKASTSRGFSPYFVGLLTETKAPPSELKNYDVSKISTPFPKCGDGENERLTESVSFSFKEMRDENTKNSSHERSYMFDFQNSPNLLCGKDNDSGYLSEQDLTEKASDTSSEDLKSNRILERKDSVTRVPTALVSARTNNPSRALIECESKYQNKELFMNGNALDKLPSRCLTRGLEDELPVPEYTDKREKEPQKRLLGKHQEFQNHEDVKFGDANVVSDDHIRSLHTPLRESGYLQKKVIDLEHENADIRKQINPLTAIIQTLTEQNSKYQNQIRNLHDEKNDIQGKLMKSDSDCKECLKEVKRLVKKCKELQQQKLSLEEKQDQLCAQNQQALCNLEDIQKKNQKAQESVATLMQEKGDLTVALEASEKQVSAFQEESNLLGAKISQLTENKRLLEQELGEKRKEIQQLKNHEKTAITDMEALVAMIQSLKDEKARLEQKFQESLNVKEALQRELEEAQSGRTEAEEKFVNECKNAKMETGVLQIKLSNLEKECERLKTGVALATEENWFLKKEVKEHKEEASELKNKIRQLSEELLLMENKMCSTENEREVLKFEVHRLQRNTAALKDRLSTVVPGQGKKYSSGSRGQNYQPDHFAETCEEIASYQHFSFIHIPPGNSRQPPTIYPSKKL